MEIGKSYKDAKGKAQAGQTLLRLKADGAKGWVTQLRLPLTIPESELR